MEIARSRSARQAISMTGVIMIEEQLTEKIIGAAIEVHRVWGPGLYEEIYERSLICV